MRSCHKRICIHKDIVLFLTVIIAVFMIIGTASLLFAGNSDRKLLADKHKDAGVECSFCHKETPPQQSSPTAVCIECHADYDAIAKATEKVEPNPHDSHEGKLDCGVCHHVHKESEFYCSHCHAFGLKVP